MQPLIPDTLELTDRAELALHHITTSVDPALRYAPFFYLNMQANPPFCQHENWDYGDVTGRYIDAAAGLRQMTGSKAGLDAEEKLKELLLSTFDSKDGLTHRQVNPWTPDEAGMFDQGRTLGALVSWYMATRDKKLLQTGDRFVQGLWDIKIHATQPDKGYSFCFQPYAAYSRGIWNAKEPAEPTCYGGGCEIYPLVKYAQITGNERALELAGKLVNFIVYESRVFAEDGVFRPKVMANETGHLHSKTLTVLGVLKYAVFQGRKDLVAWAKGAYDFSLTAGTRFGWFPEGIGLTEADSTPWSETCCTVDIIELAMLLARNGYPECWNDAERFTRNYLMEAQLTDTSWLAAGGKKRPKDTRLQRYTNAPDMMLGGFVGRALPHDFIGDGHMMACCCGAGARAIYQVWDHAIDFTDGKLRVNLLVNRRSPWAEVQSWLPHQGKVLVTNAKAESASIRLPDYVRQEEVKAHKNGKPSAARAKRGWVELTGLKPGDEVCVEWPLRTVRRRESILKWKFEVTWRGDTVVAISPAGEKVPMYQRDHMKPPSASMRPRPAVPRKDATVHW